MNRFEVLKHFRTKLENVSKFDMDKELERLRTQEGRFAYPAICGSLNTVRGWTVDLASELLESLENAYRRLLALELAAETVLDEEEITCESRIYELLYSAADTVENSLKDTDPDALCRHLRSRRYISCKEIEDGRIDMEYP